MDIWKFLISGGLLGLLLSSVFLVIVIYRLSPMLQSRRQLSLRDQHTNLVSRYGGVALFWGFFGTLFLVWWLPFEQRGLGLQLLPEIRLAGLTIGGLMAWGLGFADDIFIIRARWKLTWQIGIALFAMGFGFVIQTIQIPFFQAIDLGFWAWPLTVLWIVGMMNAVNLIDGLDGLASGITIIALVSLATICLWQGQIPLMLLILILIGSTLGFWSFNRPPATVFMGDSGSLFLGFTIAVLCIWVFETPQGIPILPPILLMAIPLLDTAFAVFRRLLIGIPFYSADNDHLHHRLIGKGFSSAQAMVILVIGSILFCSLSLLAYRMTHLQGFTFLGGVFLAYLLLYWLEYDVIRKPISSILGKGEHKKHRILMMALAEKIDFFFAKDPDIESTKRSFLFWTNLAGVCRIESRLNNTIIWSNGPENISHRILLFHHCDREVRVSLPESSWKIDSDIKGKMLEKVCIAFLFRLEQLDKNSVIPFKKQMK